MADFETKGLTDFQQKLQTVERKAPDRIEDKLDKLGKDLRKGSKDKTPVRSGKLKKKYKLFENEKIPGGYQKKMTNTAPHFHLIEKGHRLVTKSGKEIGFVEGEHMVERTMKEMEETVPEELEQWLDDLFKELK